MASEDASREQKRLVPKPAFISSMENRLGNAIVWHPNTLSSLKLVVVGLLFLSLKQVGWLPTTPWLVTTLFASFALLDYLDGVVARAKDLDSHFGRIFDRATDYPLLLALSALCIDFLPLPLLLIKLGLDGVLLALYALGRGSTENRLRTGIQYTMLLTLLFVCQGWGRHFLTSSFVIDLLILNIVFSSLVVLYNLGLLKTYLLADLLSAGNAACGIMAIYLASVGKPEKSLLFLLLGAAFDGFDGAVARKFGGTRWGVYSDDVADAITNGVAPGAIVYFALGGLEGILVGGVYTVFTFSRLIFFTLNKDAADPRYFAGVPSTIGAMIVSSGAALFPGSPGIIGLLVGIACALMVAFESQYRHLGRALAAKPGYLWGLGLYLALLIAGGFLWGKSVPMTVILLASLAYGFLPSARLFARLMRQRGENS